MTADYRWIDIEWKISEYQLKQTLYKLLARIACFICHGKCCQHQKFFIANVLDNDYKHVKTKSKARMMFFEDEEKDGARRCRSYDPITGGCIYHNEIHSVAAEIPEYDKKKVGSLKKYEKLVEYFQVLMLCGHYKCKALNILSQMTNQPIYNGIVKLNIHS